MSEIILEERFDKKGKYMGKIVIPITDLTPEFLNELKNDKYDRLRWKQYRKVMKEHGYNIGEVELE